MACTIVKVYARVIAPEGYFLQVTFQMSQVQVAVHPKVTKPNSLLLVLKGVNLNYRFGAAAKGLLRTISCVKLF